ncbi:MAG: transposase [Verrucomicrobiaceae bacterium]|nr:transposase [Verrucomicrobiaceae bacterium]
MPDDFIGFDPTSSLPAEGFTAYDRHLPHWRLPGACYFTTFRLRDSIPHAILKEMKQEKEQWEKRLAQAAAAANGRLRPDEIAAWQEFQRARLRKLESKLDEGHGECLLRDPAHRRIVTGALHHFVGQRCKMLAYAVMPNHVHVLCRPIEGHWLEDLCGSWKWFTAQEIQKALCRTGPLWQEENFDRLIRDAGHYRTTVRYIAKNPMKARLGEDEAAVWFCEGIRNANTNARTGSEEAAS